ncbi:hypothetical protein PSU4_59250 [Pseudonocardia sulfidoxydans NBRC 16205]|uniref:Uncharacterized protein n=1 Tax=Pseudonocardia sulfidoxydans NBRC 16205 TaxID=1223511 RepID=A0A511DQ54_9PSEU|nr:hypothetical protein PSU4_59250 [Pseudonocardia sulfidoxydans NBRC 16205]
MSRWAAAQGHAAKFRSYSGHSGINRECQRRLMGRWCTALDMLNDFRPDAIWRTILVARGAEHSDLEDTAGDTGQRTAGRRAAGTV